MSTPGSAVSFETFFLSHYPRAVAIAQRILGDRAGAEDAAQEAFARFSRRRTPDAPDASGWLYLAAAHAALNELRSRRRRAQRERTVVRLDARGRAALEGDGDPAEMLARSDVRALVGATLARLPQRDASLLALRHGGLSYRDIAESLHVPEAHVGTLLARAQRAFRKEFEHGLSD
ncbi:MAG: sigma-70 family RNA polymerase sigma factor [bacterium]|nr:sigma-70 family RNA polymerase sigma factor [bacterium]